MEADDPIGCFRGLVYWAPPLVAVWGVILWVVFG